MCWLIFEGFTFFYFFFLSLGDLFFSFTVCMCSFLLFLPVASPFISIFVYFKSLSQENKSESMMNEPHPELFERAT